MSPCCRLGVRGNRCKEDDSRVISTTKRGEALPRISLSRTLRDHTESAQHCPHEPVPCTTEDPGPTPGLHGHDHSLSITSTRTSTANTEHRENTKHRSINKAQATTYMIMANNRPTTITETASAQVSTWSTCPKWQIQQKQRPQQGEPPPRRTSEGPHSPPNRPGWRQRQPQRHPKHPNPPH